jgi:quinol monooxygenase YgiN
MFGFLIALAATLGGLVSTGLLVMRTYNERRPHLVAWSVTVVGLTIALAAMAIGFVAGYSTPLFRAVEIGGALIAPVWLAVGVIVLISHFVQVRFAAWLGAISYSIVAVVVLLLDPVIGSFDKSLPKPASHYNVLPASLLNVAHVVVVIALVVCAAVCALQARDRAREAYEYLLPIALVALAGVLIVMGAGGYLPGPLAALALGAAAGLVAFGGIRTAPDASAPKGEDSYEDSYEEPHTGYDQGLPGGTGPVARPAPAPPAYAPPAPPVAMPMSAPPAAAPTSPEMYGQITVFTLLEGRQSAFDRQARDAIRAARDTDPDLVIYTCHEVVGAPTQRIFYQLFRDQAAFQDHQRMPYVLRFLGESRTHVLATNVIELKLSDAKVLPLPSLMDGRR